MAQDVDKYEKNAYNLDYHKKGECFMLLNFKVSNFASFDDMQELSMSAGKVRAHSERLYTDNKNKILKFMAIYGANASGKSNLVSAFEFAKTIILDGFTGEFSDLYCKLKEENKGKNSHFEFTILINGKKYTYGFETVLTMQSFKKEWLFELTYGDNKKVVFERDTDVGTFKVDSYFKDAAINERLTIYAEDIKNDSSVLFLSIMNKNKGQLYESNGEIILYRKIFNWFKFRLSVNFSDRPVTNYSYLLNEESIEAIGKLLNNFGTGISRFTLVDVPIEKITNNVPKELIKEITNSLVEQQRFFEGKHIGRIPAIMLRGAEDATMFIIKLSENEISAQTLQFNHENTNAFFSLSEESDGTVRLLDLIEILLCDDQEKVYIIDEINRRFHPLLTRKFVEEYLKLAEERNIQLIVTTHESKIMDLDLLRKDEIGFVDKGIMGESTFFTMDTFGERFDKKVCAAYFKGEYDAIPRFKF